MNFVFNSSSVSDDSDEPEERVQPSWMGAPEDVLGVSVPAELFLARTANVVIALSNVMVYPNGCVLSVHIAGRQANLDEDAWWNLADAGFGQRHHPRRKRQDGRPSDEERRFGVRYRDGRTATTLGGFPHWQPGASDPAAPLLTHQGGGGGSSGVSTFQIDERLWLWPLPPAEPFELITEWPLAGIPVTIVELDGAAINTAAGRSLPYWPDPDDG
jgi:hypothetical protein